MRLVVSAPSGWTPDNAIYGNNFIPNEKLKERLIELGNEDGLVKYLSAETGKILYIAEPKIIYKDNSNRN